MVVWREDTWVGPKVHGASPRSRCAPFPWEEKRPGFVEMDLVAHCGDHLDGSFLYTLTLTDLATGWTECLPLLEKSANAVRAALEQARTLFPFPLLGTIPIVVGSFSMRR